MAEVDTSRLVVDYYRKKLLLRKELESKNRSLIVKASSGPRFVVDCHNRVDKEKLVAGTRVALNMITLIIMRASPREVDPVVHSMLHEDPGNVSFAAVGGLTEQIRQLRESIELPLMNPELFLRVGIKPPKVVFCAIVDEHIGESASLIREMFGYARHQSSNVLDPTFLYPGRLDWKIEIPLPNEQARTELLKIHSASITKHGESNYEVIVKAC